MVNDKLIKYDSYKTRIDLIPPELIEEVGKILTYGATKYNDRNWEKGTDWSRYFASAQRHLWSWFGGEDNDTETGENHLSHVLCSITFLLTYAKRNIGNDDRVKIKLKRRLNKIEKEVK